MQTPEVACLKFGVGVGSYVVHRVSKVLSNAVLSATPAYCWSGAQDHKWDPICTLNIVV